MIVMLKRSLSNVVELCFERYLFPLICMHFPENRIFLVRLKGEMLVKLRYALFRIVGDVKHLHVGTGLHHGYISGGGNEVRSQLWGS